MADLCSQTLRRRLSLLPYFIVWISLPPKKSYPFSYGPYHLKGSIICQELHPFRSLPLSLPHSTPTYLVELAVSFLWSYSTSIVFCQTLSRYMILVDSCIYPSHPWVLVLFYVSPTYSIVPTIKKPNNNLFMEWSYGIIWAKGEKAKCKKKQKGLIRKLNSLSIIIVQELRT